MTHKEQAASFMYDAIKQALDDMQLQHSICHATKCYLQVAIVYADAGIEPHYDSYMGTWTFPPTGIVAQEATRQERREVR